MVSPLELLMGVGLPILTIECVMNGIRFADELPCAPLEAEERSVLTQSGFGSALEDRPADCPWCAWVTALDLDPTSMSLVQQEH